MRTAKRIVERTLRLALVWIVSATPLACGDGPSEPEDPNMPPGLRDDPMTLLELVPYEALGSNRIAFHRQPGLGGVRGVYVVDGASGTWTSHLGGSNIINPHVSRDGSTLAFKTPSRDLFGSAWDVFASDLDATEVTRVSETDGSSESGPVWTPDGEVMFAEYVAGVCCNAQLRRGLPSGGLADAVFTFPNGTLVTSSMDLTQSPTGAIAYNLGPRIMLVAPVGMDISVVYEPVVVESELTRTSGPAWSPDGLDLGFLEVVYENDTGRYVETRVKRVEVATGEVTLLAAVADAFTPAAVAGAFSSCWTLDAETIVFTAPAGGDHHVHTVPADGGEVVSFTSVNGVSDVSVSCF